MTTIIINNLYLLNVSLFILLQIMSVAVGCNGSGGTDHHEQCNPLESVAIGYRSKTKWRTAKDDNIILYYSYNNAVESIVQWIQVNMSSFHFLSSLLLLSFLSLPIISLPLSLSIIPSPSFSSLSLYSLRLLVDTNDSSSSCYLTGIINILIIALSF